MSRGRASPPFFSCMWFTKVNAKRKIRNRTLSGKVQHDVEIQLGCSTTKMSRIQSICSLNRMFPPQHRTKERKKNHSYPVISMKHSVVNWVNVSFQVVTSMLNKRWLCLQLLKWEGAARKKGNIPSACEFIFIYRVRWMFVLLKMCVCVLQWSVSGGRDDESCTPHSHELATEDG